MNNWIEDQYVREFNKVLTNKQIKAMKQYLRGLTTEMRSFSVQGFTNLLKAPYDSIDYFISRAKWDERKLNKIRFQQDISTAADKEFDFAVDETGILKHTEKPYFIARQWIGGIGKIDKCFSNVCANFVNNTDNIPFDISHYIPSSKLASGRKDSEFKTKLELFISLCIRAYYMSKELGISLHYFLFDSWFASSRNLNIINDGNMKYFTEIRVNRSVLAGESWVKAKDLVTVLNHTPKTLSYKNKTFKVSAFTSRLKNVNHPTKIIVVNGRFRKRKETRIFITNNLTFNELDVMSSINRRWQIEYFFRESKSYLAFDQAKYHKLVCYRRHFYLTLAAWSISKLHIKHKLANITTTFAFVRYKTLLEFHIP